jgi:hypothetical protein
MTWVNRLGGETTLGESTWGQNDLYSSKPNRKLHLTLFNSEVAKLMAIIDPTMDLKFLSQKEVEMPF